MTEEITSNETSIENPSFRDELGILWKSLGKWVKSIFAVEESLQRIYKEPENEEEKKKIAKLRKINLIEFILSLALVFTFMWAIWWVGIVKDNDKLVQTSYILIGVVGVWGILFSPFFHYWLEKGYTYRKGYLGLDYEQNYWTAWFEERGFGSLKKHWEINLKKRKRKKLVNFMTLFVMLSLVLVLMDDLDYAMDLAEALGVEDEQTRFHTAITAVVWAYQLVGILMLIYCTYLAGSWEDTGHLDKIKKTLLILIPAIVAFMGIWVTWGFGLDFHGDGSWSVGGNWETTAYMYQSTMTNGKTALFVVVFFILLFVVWFLLKYVFIGMLIRFDNLKTASYQFLFVSVIAVVVILSVYGILASPGLQDYVLSHQDDQMSSVPYGERLWFIFDSTAIVDWKKASFAGFMGNWAGYIYWGLVQEWLFLGYWCTLLAKSLKNKYVIAFLSSLCFGVIHFPSWPLMIFTMAGGYFWALAWIDGKRYRNLFIFGMIHGFAGTLVAKIIPITMSVGPSNMA